MSTVHATGRRIDRRAAATKARYRATLTITDDLGGKAPATRRVRDPRTTRRTVRQLLHANLIGDPHARP